DREVRLAVPSAAHRSDAKPIGPLAGEGLGTTDVGPRPVWSGEPVPVAGALRETVHVDRHRVGAVAHRGVAARDDVGERSVYGHLPRAPPVTTHVCPE